MRRVVVACVWGCVAGACASPSVRGVAFVGHGTATIGGLSGFARARSSTQEGYGGTYGGTHDPSYGGTYDVESRGGDLQVAILLGDWNLILGREWAHDGATDLDADELGFRKYFGPSEDRPASFLECVGKLGRGEHGGGPLIDGFDAGPGLTLPIAPHVSVDGGLSWSWFRIADGRDVSEFRLSLGIRVVP